MMPVGPLSLERVERKAWQKVVFKTQTNVVDLSSTDERPRQLAGAALSVYWDGSIGTIAASFCYCAV
jgi:hypothetical protein